MYGRRYRINATVTAPISSPATGVDLLEINAPSDAVVLVHEVKIEQSSETDSEQLPVKIHRGTTSGSGGASVTPTPMNVGDAAFGGTVEAGNTAKSSEGDILEVGGFNVLNPGWYFQPKEEGVIVISPSGRVVVELEAAPTDDITIKVSALIEEIGG